MNNIRRKQLHAVNKTLSGCIIQKLNDLRDRLTGIKNEIESQYDELEAIRIDEEDAYDNTPENLQGSQRYMDSEEALDSMSDALDSLNEAIDAVENASESLSEIS